MKNNYIITLVQKSTNPPRVEKLEAEGTTGQQAKRRALAQHGARLGLTFIKRGRGHWNTEGWVVGIKLVKQCHACSDPDNHTRHTCGLKDLQKLLRF